MALELYRLTSVGTRVTISEDIEEQFPARQALATGIEQNSIEKRINELEKKIYDLWMKQDLAEQSRN